MYEQKCHKHNTGGDYSVHSVQGNLHLENYFQLGNTLQKKRKVMWDVSQGHNKEADVIQEEILKERVSLVWGRKRLFCFVCFIIKKRGAGTTPEVHDYCKGSRDKFCFLTPCRAVRKKQPNS